MRAMKYVILALTLPLCACQLSAPAAPVSAPSAAAPTTPEIGANCTGPSRGNFNGARLSADLIAQIPRQFAQDRAILRAVLDGKGTAEQQRFARMCHGVTI